MGAAVNISSRCWNHATSLHYCSQLGKIENVKLLIKYGANVFIKDKCGQTARDRAQKYPECEKLLQQQEGVSKPYPITHCIYFVQFFVIFVCGRVNLTVSFLILYCVFPSETIVIMVSLSYPQIFP